MSVTDKLDLIAAYTYMDSEITQSANPLQLGRPAPMTPRNMASGWIDYVVLPGLKPAVACAMSARIIPKRKRWTSFGPILRRL